MRVVLTLWSGEPILSHRGQGLICTRRKTMKSTYTMIMVVDNTKVGQIGWSLKFLSGQNSQDRVYPIFLMDCQRFAELRARLMLVWWSQCHFRHGSKCVLEYFAQPGIFGDILDGHLCLLLSVMLQLPTHLLLRQNLFRLFYDLQLLFHKDCDQFSKITRIFVTDMQKSDHPEICIKSER